MSIYTRAYMLNLHEEEKKKEAERLATQKKQMLTQMGTIIITQAMNVAKHGKLTSSSYSYQGLSNGLVFTIDEMIEYLQTQFPDSKVQRDNLNIVIDWS